VPSESLLSTRTLVLGMIDESGRLDAGLLYDVAAGCGMSDQQVRLCLRRLVAEGLLSHGGGRGRKAVFTAVDADVAAILPEMEYVRLAYRQDAGHAPWDGVWHLAAFSVPESRRHARDELRRHLRFLGGAAAGGGLYVCANDWDRSVSDDADRLGVGDQLTLARTGDLRVGGVTEPRAVAARLWPLDSLAADWIEFGRRLADRHTSAADDRDRLGAAFATAVEFSQIMERDPLLPPELLPPGWPGAASRAAMLDVESEVGTPDSPLASALHRLSVRAVMVP
jgi:phenylacetic acid degradation operon negative regulatory protein